MDLYLAHLRRVHRQTGARNIVIGGDSNAKCSWWGSPVTDRRGEEMRGALDELGMCIVNQGEIPTFDTIRGGKRYSSYVDITAMSPDLFGLVDDWRVCDNLTSSDNNGISFLISSKFVNTSHINQTTRKYYTKEANWAQFNEKLSLVYSRENFTKDKIENLKTGPELDETVTSLNKYIAEACTESITLIKRKDVVSMPWWNEELAALKREVATKRRSIRCAAPVRREFVVGEYLEAREKYKSEL
ncbi:unnamed protein product [Euphydryas editha]|nr:unnamed protein product [Euphydryas editha]